MKTSFSKRVVAVVLSVMMIVTMIPMMVISASAATTVSTYDELVNAIENGGDITLANDIDIEAEINVAKDVTISGNYTIAVANTNIKKMFVESNENVKLTMENVTLDGNGTAQWAITAYTGNGGKNPNNEINLTGCTVKNFVGYTYVGAINAFGRSTANITNCTFENNTTTVAPENEKFSGADVWAGAAAKVNIVGGTMNEVYLNSGKTTAATASISGGAKLATLKTGVLTDVYPTYTISVDSTVENVVVQGEEAPVVKDITTADELVKAAALGGSYKLGNDIVLTKASIDCTATACAGVVVKNDFVLDGANKTISATNKNITKMFVENNKDVKLTLKDVTLDGQEMTKWAITAYTLNGGKNPNNEINLTNCTVKNFVGMTYVGAINAFGSCTATLTDCTFENNTTTVAPENKKFSGADVWAGAAATLNINGGSYEEVYGNVDKGGNAIINVTGDANIDVINLGVYNGNAAEAIVSPEATVNHTNINGVETGVQVVMADGKVNIVVTSYEGAEVTIGGVEGDTLALAPADAADFNKEYAVTVDGTNVGTFTMNKYISKLEDGSNAVAALEAFEKYAKAAANVFRGAAYDVKVEDFNFTGVSASPLVRDDAFCSVSVDCSAQTRLIVYVDGVAAGTPIMVNGAETDLVTLDCGSTDHTAAAVPVNSFNNYVKITVDGKTIQYSVRQAAKLLSGVEKYKDLANAMAWYGQALADM